MNIALILVIENSETNLGAGLSYHNKEYKAISEPLEIEAIRCVESWREWAGQYKDIPIYCICPSKRTPNKSTIQKLKKLNVIYIEKYFNETDTFTSGYWNIPLCGQWFEKVLKEKMLLHIDLDMILLKEPSKELISLNDDSLAKIGILSKQDKKDIHILDKTIVNFESCFILSYRKSGFYNKWYNLLKDISMRYSPDWIRYADLEEFAIDHMYHIDREQIEILEHYQVGPRYKAKHIPTDMLDNIFFIHRHDYESQDEYGKYLRRYINEVH